KGSSVAIRPIGLQFPANRLDRRSASPQVKQPSSTSTSTSTVSLSTITMKSDAIHGPIVKAIVILLVLEGI
ncbi:MAG: hypothetical protein DWH99_12625, partial [Planctomycetota bacterium]